MASPTKKVIDEDSGFRALKLSFSKKNAYIIDVGFADDATAIYALANEFGTSRIPERSFIRSAMRANKGKYEKLLQAAAFSISDSTGKPKRPRATLRKLANKIRTDIILSIQNLKSPPNAPSTIAAKKSSNPLVDTGHMQRALIVSIRKK